MGRENAIGEKIPTFFDRLMPIVKLALLLKREIARLPSNAGKMLALHGAAMQQKMPRITQLSSTQSFYFRQFVVNLFNHLYRFLELKHLCCEKYWPRQTIKKCRMRLSMQFGKLRQFMFIERRLVDVKQCITHCDKIRIIVQNVNFANFAFFMTGAKNQSEKI